MMRSLWTAASGMIAQQTNVDTISNNLSNVNTVGYKNESAEFKSLLYQTIQTKSTSANSELKPIGAQVGLGTRNSSITSHYTQGVFTSTSKSTDFAIEGNGFFSVRNLDGEILYTRNGGFNVAMAADGNIMLCTSEGFSVLDSEGNPISFPPNTDMTKVTIDDDGNICYPDELNNPTPTGIVMGIYQFANPSGLEKMGGSLLKETAASGEAMNEAEIEGLTKSKVKQGYVESSNVQVVDEMVNLIVAQRAYEINSKAIQAADDMLQQANNLKK
ncbi:MAG: flagellar basal-body rod protein FlgG [Lachnospiraceae bacterium]|nr:flagellar basal-body rod protein FlgG [Lachnospiraceae bacterium]